MQSRPQMKSRWQQAMTIKPWIDFAQYSVMTLDNLITNAVLNIYFIIPTHNCLKLLIRDSFSEITYFIHLWKLFTSGGSSVSSQWLRAAKQGSIPGSGSYVCLCHRVQTRPCTHAVSSYPTDSGRPTSDHSPPTLSNSAFCVTSFVRFSV
jgi:hypothetical protein